MKSPFWSLALLCFLTLIFFLVLLCQGSTSISLPSLFAILSHQDTSSVLSQIVWEIRLPKSITAMLAGAALGVAGLQMQTLFKNPLAGPYELGVSSGASLGVGLYMLLSLSLGDASGSRLGCILASASGSFLVLLAILICSRFVVHNSILLLLGLMFGYLASGLLSLLIVYCDKETLQNFLLWSAGTFSNVPRSHLFEFFILIVLGLVPGFFCFKAMNLLQIGDDYAQSMGIDLKRIRLQLILGSSILAGTVTAFCGPLAFIGLAIPHLCRQLLQTADHRLLMPACILGGAFVGALCDWISILPDQAMPLNAVTSILGAPVVVWILLKNQKRVLWN